METVDGLLGSAAGEAGGRPALLWSGGELTYGELERRAVALSARLTSAARELPGSRVVIIAPNVPALPIAVFAAWTAGAVAVPLSARLREHELRGILRDAEPAAIVAIAEHGGFRFGPVLAALAPHTPRLLVSPAGEVVETASGSAPGGERLAADVAALLYTSGTTGAPRGALVSHGRELEGAAVLRERLALDPEDRAVLVVPISHAFGLTCFLAGVATRAAAVLVESTFSPGPLLRSVEERRATVLHGSPALFGSLLKARPEGRGTLRTGFVAGAPSPARLLEALDDRGVRVLNLYGLTETGAVASCRADDAPEVRYGTVGRPLPSFAVRVAGDGVLELRGAHVTRGYYRRGDDGAFVDGWFRTGDLAELDGDAIRIVGRAKDIVHVGGFNVVPAEVEAVLLEHPEVVQAVVVGRPDERMGEALAAFVVVRPGSAVEAHDLVGFARSRIAGYKVPYALRILPRLPLLASGKPDRRTLAGS